MCQLPCGLGMEEHLVKDFFDINLMEINKLVDLNNLRTAPQLSNSQIKKLLEEIEENIFKADWITIGIMAPCDVRAIEVLQSISKKVKLLINDLIMMIELKRSKKNRSKNALFNPYKNGISSYDMAYLSSKRNLKKKTVYLKNDSNKDYFAA